MIPYRKLFQASLADPAAFWAEAAQAVTWESEPERILDDDLPEIAKAYAEFRAQHPEPSK